MGDGRLQDLGAALDTCRDSRCCGRARAFEKTVPKALGGIPHPYIFAPRQAMAMVGKPFRAELKMLRSLGDPQHRYAKPTRQYWEREEYESRLGKAPDWLKLDRQTGILSGTPGPNDEGTTEVEVVARRRYRHEVAPTATRGHLFQRTASHFQATHRHIARLRVPATDRWRDETQLMELPTSPRAQFRHCQFDFTRGKELSSRSFPDALKWAVNVTICEAAAASFGRSSFAKRRSRRHPPRRPVSFELRLPLR